jgi:hypothetical protein
MIANMSWNAANARSGTPNTMPLLVRCPIAEPRPERSSDPYQPLPELPNPKAKP